jgi:uncharacterized protein YjiS (DUF1127 family)
MSIPLVQGWTRTLTQILGGHALVHQNDSSSLANGLMDTARIWIARSRQRRELGELTGDILKDIGVSREEAQREAAKPFWRG